MKKKLVVEKVTDIDNLPALSKKQEDMLAKLKDRAVDTSDISELSEDFWKDLQIGVFYRPVKKHISVNWMRISLLGLKRMVKDIKHA